MFKLIVTAAVAGSLLPALAGAAQLSELETRWLSAAGPVLAYAQRTKLPIDIIVQPVARPGDVPIAMGFDKGRCKLVLSMRGNPDAEKVLDNVPVAEQNILIEAMVAHEIGHCWRYAQGAWHALPAGFEETSDEVAADEALLAESKAMRDMRREEGFADLVALAWTKQRHPEQYGRVYAWLDGLRAEVPVARSGHDTRVYVRMARHAGVFASTGTPFDAAGVTWRKGLLSDE